MRTLIVLIALIATACGSTAATELDPEPATSVAGTATQSSVTTTPTPPSPSTSAETTTTTVGEPHDQPPSFEDVGGPIGYIGCSMSQNAVRGYQMLGSDRMWPANAPYGGGSLGRWADGIDRARTRYWEGVEEYVDAEPATTVVWFNLCTIRGAPIDNADTAELIMDEVRTFLPDAIFYVSGQPAYSGGHVCDLAGATGPEQMHDVASELVSRGVASAGPVMGPLSADLTGDGCHANEEGQLLLGQQLLDFFGA